MPFNLWFYFWWILILYLLYNTFRFWQDVRNISAAHPWKILGRFFNFILFKIFNVNSQPHFDKLKWKKSWNCLFTRAICVYWSPTGLDTVVSTLIYIYIVLYFLKLNLNSISKTFSFFITISIKVFVRGSRVVYWSRRPTTGWKVDGLNPVLGECFWAKQFEYQEPTTPGESCGSSTRLVPLNNCLQLMSQLACLRCKDQDRQPLVGGVWQSFLVRSTPWQ